MADIHKIVRPFIPFKVGVTTVIATKRKTSDENVKVDVGGNGEPSGQMGSSSYSISATWYAQQVQEEVTEGGGEG